MDLNTKISDVTVGNIVEYEALYTISTGFIHLVIYSMLAAGFLFYAVVKAIALFIEGFREGWQKG